MHARGITGLVQGVQHGVDLLGGYYLMIDNQGCGLPVNAMIYSTHLCCRLLLRIEWNGGNPIKTGLWFLRLASA